MSIYKKIIPVFIFFFCLSMKAQVTLEKVDKNWQLVVDSKPFEIRGVTFGPVDDIENYDQYFKDLEFLGVNSIRTWASSHKNIGVLLDKAHEYDIKVMMGIWMRHGRPGMEDDDSFDYLKDSIGKQNQFENAIHLVKKFKNHPAVLMWNVGNEVYLNMETDEEKIAYSKLLESICQKIKKIDPNHPIASTEAWNFGMDWWNKYVPSLEIYGLNSYGAGVQFLQDELEKRNIDKPYIITEFGPTGEWDIQPDKNGVKNSPSDNEKYDQIVKGVQEWILSKMKNLGVYVFHYESGNQHMTPWLFTHYKGLKRPQYWAIRKAYTGKEPKNKIPIIGEFKLPNKIYESEKWIPVDLKVSDPENEKLDVSFTYNQRTGSRKRRDQILLLEFKGNLKDGFQIKAPKEEGAIKIYAEVSDSFGNMAVASHSTVTRDKDAKKRKFLVPKATLPFYVYQDAKKMPYAASAYMGNYRDMEVSVNHTKDVYSGKTAIKIHYNSGVDWYGLGLVDPANDWGDILGGYDISGAKKLTFWAKASNDGINATMGFGLIDKNKKYPDSSKKTIEIQLTTEWKKYTIKTKRLDLSCIRSGFVLFSSANGFGHTIYLDDIVFE